MTNMNDRQRKLMAPKVLEQQGGYFCNICKKSPEELIMCGTLPKLYVDCIPNTGNHSNPEKLQFLGVSCNTTKNHPTHEEPLNQRDTDPIFNASRKNMARARQYVLGRMLDPKDGQLEYHQILDDMAEFLNNSQQANKNYLGKLTSKKHGIYKWELGQGGNTYLRFKKELDIDQMMNDFTILSKYLQDNPT